VSQQVACRIAEGHVAIPPRSPGRAAPGRHCVPGWSLRRCLAAPNWGGAVNGTPPAGERAQASARDRPRAELR